jgi:hypothetical protein
MYSLNMPVSAIRTKVRQEFEKHRYVSQLPAVDVLLFQSHAEFQVSPGIMITSDRNPLVGQSMQCNKMPYVMQHFARKG